MIQPGFIILGAPKAGTTALFVNMGRHPRVFLSPAKEPRHFSYRGRRPDHRGPGDESSTRSIFSDPADYAALFSECGPTQMGGEASTAYLASEMAAKTLPTFLPEAKLIVILRQPVDRAYSEWLHLSRDLRETLPFEEALAAEEDRQRQGWGHVWRYAQRGRYAEHLQRWLARVPREQMLLLRYEDWLTQPNAVVDRCWRFIGLEPIPHVSVSRENETSRLPRFRFLHSLLHTDNSARMRLRRLLPVSLRSLLKARLTRANLEKAAKLAPDIRARLTRPFLEDITRLEALTGWDLGDWKV